MHRIAQARSEVYSALAACFRPPQEGLLRERPRNGLLLALSRAAKLLSLPWLGAYGEELEALLEATGADRDQALAELEMEYNRLFAVAPLAPPYESVCRGPLRRTMGRCAVEVARCYAADGLSLSPKFKDLPDHAAAELDYLAYLSGQEALAWEGLDFGRALDCRGRALSFLQEHLGRWLPELCRRVIAGTRSPFYLCLAYLARDFVAWDQRQRETRPGSGESQEETELPPTPARRGVVEVRWDRCTLCGACVRACPSGALRIRQEGAGVSLLLKGAGCDGCGGCQLLCPEQALAVRVAEPGAGVGQREQILVRSEEPRCPGCGQALGLPASALKRLEAALGQAAALCPQCKLNRIARYGGAQGRPPKQNMAAR